MNPIARRRAVGFLEANIETLPNADRADLIFAWLQDHHVDLADIRDIAHRLDRQVDSEERLR